MVTAEQKAPGCFASPSVFSMDSVVCKECCAFKECSDAAMATLEKIRDTIDVRDLLKKHTAAREKATSEKPAPSSPIEKSPVPVGTPKPMTDQVERKTSMQKVTFELSDDAQLAIARISDSNKKAAEQAITLCKANRINEMKSELVKGRNPFAESRPLFFRVACDMLINGGFTKSSLKQRLMEELQWTEGTAASHVSIVVAIMGGFRIVAAKGEQIILHPGLS